MVAFVYPPRLPFEELESFHPEYTRYAEYYQIVDDLLEGGWAMLSQVEKFLMKKPGEEPETYKYRKKLFTYTPILSQCLSQLTNKFTTGILSVEGFPTLGIEGAFWKDFRESTDGNRRTERQTIRTAFESLIKYRRVFSIIEKPAGAAVDRRTELEEGLLPYMLVLDPRNVVHWGTANGKLAWVKVRTIEDEFSPVSGAKLKATWTFYDGESIARYSAYVERNKDGEIELNVPADATDFKQYVNLEGTVIQHERRGIPVTMAELPWELWVCNQAMPMILEHIRVKNNLSYCANIAGLMQRLFTPMQTDATKDVDPQEFVGQFGNEKVAIGSSFSFNETTGGAITNVGKYLADLEVSIRDLTFANSITSDPSRSNIQESGVAKSMDFINQEEALRTYGALLVRWIEESYRQVADAYGAPAKPQDISANGLTEFTLDTVDAKIARLASLESLKTPLSRTAIKMLSKELCKALVPTASSAEQDTFSEEVNQVFEDLENTLQLSVEDALKLFEAGALSLRTLFEAVRLDPDTEIEQMNEEQEAAQAEEDALVEDQLSMDMLLQQMGADDPNAALAQESGTNPPTTPVKANV